MKKAIYLLLISLLLLGAVGCSADEYANISKRDEAVISIGTTNYTRGSFYDAMMASDPTGVVMTKLSSMIYAKEINADDSDVQAEADAEVTAFKEAAGEMLSIYLYYYQLGSIEDYRNAVVTSLKQSAVIKKYMNDNFETIASDIHPCKVRIIQANSQENGDAALAALQSGVSFTDVAATYSSTIFTGTEQIIHKNSTSIDEVIKLLLQSEVTVGIAPTVLVNSEGTYWYVVEFTDVDANNFKDELITQLISEQSTIADDAFAYYAKQGNFKVYDVDLYNTLKTDYADYLNQ